ncbi:MAG: AAA family ATPase [Gemmatimonadales bacterium]|nr:AAA family ATPase [Gemmatimonadales bacterium]
MRLTSVTVERYRSITKAYKIRLSDYTVLVGPNNEGKSNVLRALAAAMSTLRIYASVQVPVRMSAASTRMRTRRFYDWSQDFPLHLQSKSRASQESVVTLEFELDRAELGQFRSTVGSKLNGMLPISVTFGPEGFNALTILKQGRGGATLTKKSNQVARFVASRLRFEHIPAVRTAEAAQGVVERLVAGELSRLEDDPEYLAAVKLIAELQAPILAEVSQRIHSTLQPFLPSMTQVDVLIPAANRFQALREACQIFLDDGARTLLVHKGDGVQSLAALALMRDASTGKAVDAHLIVAIEEPESHLHPGAIQELRRLLESMSQDHQVLVTTHNPLFVDRTSCSNNVIVKNKRAQAATSLAQLREALGVRASDNLQHASLALVVEGECDRVAMAALLAARSPFLASALKSNSLCIDSLQGGSKLSYRLGMLRVAMCPYHVLLDADAAGLAAGSDAVGSGLLSTTEVTYTTCFGKQESELEDWYIPDLYVKPILDRFGVRLVGPRMQSKKKWSLRVGEVFTASGKAWDEVTKLSVKALVADLVKSTPGIAVTPPAEEALASLIEALTLKLSAHSGGDARAA